MKIYVATKLSNAAEHQLLARTLYAANHEITYDWTGHGSVQATPERFGEIAAKELAGVLQADAVVVILPGGNGTHVELGAALGANIPVILVGSENERRWGASYPSVFWHLSQVIRVLAAPCWELEVLRHLNDIAQYQRPRVQA